MPGKNADFTIRYEELVPLARLLRTHFTRDAADFVELLPKQYGKQFLPDYDARLEAANAVISARGMAARAQALGQRMAATGEQLPGLLNRLEARARRAENLTVPLKALGVKAARDAYASADMERVDTALKLLLRHLDDNAATLSAQGHTPAETEQIRDLHQSLMADSAAQDVEQTNNQRLTAANVDTLNHLYALMRNLLADGKSLYRSTDPVKLRDYTLAQLEKRVRREQSRPEEAAV